MTLSIPAFHRPRPSLVPLLAAVLIAGLTLTGCDSTGPNADASTSPMTLAVTSRAAPSGASTAASAKQAQLTDAAGTVLTLDRVEIVLHEIEFDRDDDAEACGRGSDDDDARDDDCESVEAGPVLVTLPLADQTPVVVIETQISEGAWEEVEFEIEPLDRDDADDRALLDASDFPEDVSIRVTGTYARAGESPRAFTYTSDLDAEKEIEFEPPLRVAAGEPTGVTFAIHVDAWFRTPSGLLVDPAQAGDDGPYEDLVEDNIEDSFDGYEDRDRDGSPDDDDDDGDDD
jgi:outer membrane murein-binding lipoprotein Lpp